MLAEERVVCTELNLMPYRIDMAENSAVTIINASRNLRALPFRPSEDQLTIGKHWEDWLEEIEREFRYFKITSTLDKKDAIIIYGGQEIARLERSLPNPEDPHGELDVYKKLRKKLNDYFIPKRNTHYSRYMFSKMLPEREETTVAYATRLREKAHDCNFGSNYDERILEHLIQTIENSILIQKCISKSWTLQEFLMEAQQIEDISTQMQIMKPSKWNKEIHKVKAQQRSVDSSGIYCKTKTCSYCGLTGAHRKGRDCPAYGVQCEICNKYDHFTAVCRFNGRRQNAEIKSTRRDQDEQVRRWRINTADGEYPESDTSSDEEFLEKAVSHMRIKTVKELSDENLNLSRKIGGLQDSVSRFEKELEAAKKIISSLVSQKIHQDTIHAVNHQKKWNNSNRKT